MRCVEVCYYCGRPLSRRNRTIDHLRPLSKGGLDRPSNKVHACKECNRDKGCLLLEEWRLIVAFRIGLLGRVKLMFPGEMAKRDA